MYSFNKIMDFENVWVLEPKKHLDERGYFQEIFNLDEFENITGINFVPVQENESCSHEGVMRGMHFQVEPHEQAKLVKCLKGKILDVIMDITPSSLTFKKIFGVILSEKNNKQLFVPSGFAHGFISLENNSVIRYLTNNYYNNIYETGYHFSKDILLKGIYSAIDENFTLEEANRIINLYTNEYEGGFGILSEKDLNLPVFTF